MRSASTTISAHRIFRTTVDNLSGVTPAIRVVAQLAELRGDIPHPGSASMEHRARRTENRTT